MKFEMDDHKAFIDDINAEGFHIYGRKNAQDPAFYPTPFPHYPKLTLSDVEERDLITIRAFFADTKASPPRRDSGQINLEVEWVDHDEEHVWGNIVVDLPKHYALARGTSIELEIDEVLFIHD
jgi:hypothetical protein